MGWDHPRRRPRLLRARLPVLPGRRHHPAPHHLHQVTYGVTVPVTALDPGDLLFFNDGTNFGHVAIYLGNGLMIQAPHTGTVVQINPVSPASIELARRIIVNP